jgi:hypothetical protein
MEDYSIQYSVKGKDNSGREVMWNVRGTNPEEFGKNLKYADQWLMDVHPLNWNPSDQPAVPAPAEVTVTVPATSPVAPEPPADKPAEKTYNAGGVIRVKNLRISADPNGLPMAEFYAEGHKYADFKFNLGKDAESRVKAIIKLLEPTGAWKPELVVIGKNYTVDYDVEWKPSEKLNREGNPYKNIVSVTKSVHSA